MDNIIGKIINNEFDNIGILYLLFQKDYGRYKNNT